MIGNDDTESRAIAAAVAGAADQSRLDAGVNITGLLIDLDNTDHTDARRYLMCWHLTRVLAPSLAEKVRPALVRKARGTSTPPPQPSAPPHQSPPAILPPDGGDPEPSPHESRPKHPEREQRTPRWGRRALASGDRLRSIRATSYAIDDEAAARPARPTRHAIAWWGRPQEQSASAMFSRGVAGQEPQAAEAPSRHQERVDARHGFGIRGGTTKTSPLCPADRLQPV